VNKPDKVVVSVLITAAGYFLAHVPEFTWIFFYSIRFAHCRVLVFGFGKLCEYHPTLVLFYQLKKTLLIGNVLISLLTSW